MNPRVIPTLSHWVTQARRREVAREQIDTLIDAATKPVIVTWHDANEVTIEDADGRTALRLQWLCQAIAGIDGYTRVQVGGIAIAAKARGR